MTRHRWLLAFGLMTVLLHPRDLAAQPFEFDARLDKRFGGEHGTLAITSDGAAFHASGTPERRWPYDALKQVRLEPNRIVLDTYEDQAWLKLGADRSYAFELAGAGVPPSLVAFLLDRFERPVVTAVMPPLPPTPLVRAAVKHQRRGDGSEGALLAFEHGLAYVTEGESEARYWRLRDIASVLQIDPRRLILTAYEGGGTQLYTFELKGRLRAEGYEQLWQRVNAPREMKASH